MKTNKKMSSAVLLPVFANSNLPKALRPKALRRILEHHRVSKGDKGIKRVPLRQHSFIQAKRKRSKDDPAVGHSLMEEQDVKADPDSFDISDDGCDLKQEVKKEQAGFFLYTILPHIPQ